MLPSASRLTFRTHFDPTTLASFGGGTNSHVSLLINELYSASKVSFHFSELLPPKASFTDCWSSFSAAKDSDVKHSSDEMFLVLFSVWLHQGFSLVA